jgi:transcriptional regulator with XRE-family HTH domain
MTNLLDTTDPVQLGERIRLARVRADLTQQEAADKLKLARTTLVALEKGQRRLRADELKSMSMIYGISTNALLRPTAVLTNLVPRFRAIAPNETEAVDAALLLNDLAHSMNLK